MKLTGSRMTALSVLGVMMSSTLLGGLGVAEARQGWIHNHRKGLIVAGVAALAYHHYHKKHKKRVYHRYHR